MSKFKYLLKPSERADKTNFQIHLDGFTYGHSFQLTEFDCASMIENIIQRRKIRYKKETILFIFKIIST